MRLVLEELKGSLISEAKAARVGGGGGGGGGSTCAEGGSVNMSPIVVSPAVGPTAADPDDEAEEEEGADAAGR